MTRQCRGRGVRYQGCPRKGFDVQAKQAAVEEKEGFIETLTY